MDYDRTKFSHHPHGSRKPIENAAGALETDARISFSQPAFSTFGEVTNVGKSTVYDSVRPLTIADRYITVTQPGLAITLPVSPIDGQTHSIKYKARRGEAEDAIDISGGLKTIDGQPLPVTLKSCENATFRYSAAPDVDEWERR